MKERKTNGFRQRALAAALLSALLVSAVPAPAHAGLYDRVKDIFELPGEVDELKREYQRVKESYDDTLKQLEETRLQAEEYRKLQEQLMADNAKLLEQNRQLAETVRELQNSEEARSRQSGRMERMIWTAVLLVAGYFAAARIVRLILRARSR